MKEFNLFPTCEKHAVLLPAKNLVMNLSIVRRAEQHLFVPQTPQLDALIRQLLLEYKDPMNKKLVC
jgi:hypothetical protein